MCRQERFKSTGILRAEWQIRINTRISDSMVNHKLLSRGIRARRPTRTLFLIQTWRESALSGHTSIASETYVIKEMWYYLINPGFSCIVAVVVSKYGVQIEQGFRKTVCCHKLLVEEVQCTSGAQSTMGVIPIWSYWTQTSILTPVDMLWKQKWCHT